MMWKRLLFVFVVLVRSNLLNDNEFEFTSQNTTKLNHLLTLSTTHKPIKNKINKSHTCFLVTTGIPRSSVCRVLDKTTGELRVCNKEEEESRTAPLEKVLKSFGFSFKPWKGIGLLPGDMLWIQISLIEIEKNDLVDSNYTQIKYPQKLNRLPAIAGHLNRKDNFAIHYKKMVNNYGSENFNFHPETYILPQNLPELQKIKESYLQHISEEQSNNDQIIKKLIAKPVFGGQGRGIKIITPDKLDEIPTNGEYLIQKYIPNPFLINKRKNTMRLYTLITSVDPLRVYLYENGIVKFASIDFSDEIEHFSTEERFRHITNQALNQNNPTFKVEDTDEDAVYTGDRWNIKGWKIYMASQGHNVSMLWDKIKDVIVKSVLAVEDTLLNEQNRLSIERGTMFQLLGTDIDLDSNLKPWFIESNVNPTLTADRSFCAGQKKSGSK